VEDPCRTKTAALLLATALAGRLSGAAPAAPPRREGADRIVKGATLDRMQPRDFMTAIDEPRLVPASAAAFMRDDEPVVGLEGTGAPRAYSVFVLERHEVINDRVGDAPIAVTWCGVAGSAVVYERSVGERVLGFGVSGALWKNNLVLYDRESGSLWSQILGEALEGPLDGRRLRALPSTVTTWGRWREAHPDTLVLVRGSESGRAMEWTERYEKDPGRLGFTGSGNPDLRLAGKTRVLGVPPGSPGNAAGIAYVLDRVTLHQDAIGPTPVLVVRDPDGPTGRVFRRTAGGREYHFRPGPSPGRAEDRETGSLWDLVAGRAISGPAAGVRLEAVPATRLYWFVWAAIHPGSELRPATAPAPGTR
jgi:hypothetical protein